MHLSSRDAQRASRRAWPAIGLVAIVLSTGLAHPAPAEAALTSRGYLVSLADLKNRMSLASEGRQPYRAAVDRLLEDANEALTISPTPRNPLRIEDTEDVFVTDAQAAYGLALAYGLTRKLTYASKARTFIVAWAKTARTLEDVCPLSGCQTSLIIGRAAPGFVFAADLIRPSGRWTSTDETLFRSWLRNTILPAASRRPNNWGDYGTLLRVAGYDYLRDAAEYAAAIKMWKSLVDLTASDGHIPEETRRGASGLNYTQSALTARLAVARISKRRGVDLFTYGRLKRSVDYIARYVLHPEDWPWGSGAEPNIHPMWEIAYQRWRDDSYEPIIRQRRPNRTSHSAVRWTTLTNGVPFS